ncbi:MAG: hypothetical protein IT326_09785 [Anaerolineae bacterium]|nr:hypothetical protein [Anaerolineae bacterium]
MEADLAHRMDNNVRLWGYLFLAYGLALSGVWALVLAGPFRIDIGGLPDAVFFLTAGLYVVIGLLSLFFRDPAMFVVYAAALFWSNLPRSFDPAHLAASTAVALLAYLVVTLYLFWCYFRFRMAASGRDRGRAARVFPSASLVLGIVGLCGIGLSFLPAVAANPVLRGMGVQAAILGFGMGLAAVLVSYPRRAAGIAGLVCAGLALMIWAADLFAALFRAAL